MEHALEKLLGDAIAYALDRGAEEVAGSVGLGRFVEVKRREQKTESLQASQSRGLSLALFVDQRFSSNSTSDLEWSEVKAFIDESLAMTRKLARDPHRALPDPALYGPAEGHELDLCDPHYDALDADTRIELIAAAEAGATSAGAALISATAELVTQVSESLQVHTNGFRGARKSSSFMLGVSATARDEGLRRPEDAHFVVARHLADLPDARSVGFEAARRAIGRVGSQKVPSGTMPLVVENRAAGRLIGTLLEPLFGASLQQRRSCFEHSLDQVIGNELLDLVDDPFIPRGLGSRLFDGDGLRDRRREVVAQGVLKTFFIDVYYGRKLGSPPTISSISNLLLTPGDQSQEALIKDLDRGILVTSFLGGNSNPATGDFSLGVSGFEIEAGKLDRPVGEMNITSSQRVLWKNLVAVGNDPYPYGAVRIPTLVFDAIQFSGS